MLLVGGLLVSLRAGLGHPRPAVTGDVQMGPEWRAHLPWPITFEAVGHSPPQLRGGGGGRGSKLGPGPQFRMWFGLPGLELLCGRALIKTPLTLWPPKPEGASLPSLGPEAAGGGGCRLHPSAQPNPGPILSIPGLTCRRGGRHTRPAFTWTPAPSHLGPAPTLFLGPSPSGHTAHPFQAPGPEQQEDRAGPGPPTPGTEGDATWCCLDRGL